jgi:hypothetical protein
MYVLEGSRLGAQVLLQAVAGSSDAAVTAATAYLRHGAGRHLWQSFLALLATAMAAKSLLMAMSFANELSRSAHLQRRALSRVAPEMLLKQFTVAGELRGYRPLVASRCGVVAVVEHICSRDY